MSKLTQPIGAIVVSPDIITSVAISGQITVTTAGTEIQGGNIALDNGVYVRALTGNTGVVYVGNDGAGAIASTNGYQLNKGEAVRIQVANLNELWFDSATNGDKFCWLKA